MIRYIIATKKKNLNIDIYFMIMKLEDIIKNKINILYKKNNLMFVGLSITLVLLFIFAFLFSLYNYGIFALLFLILPVSDVIIGSFLVIEYFEIKKDIKYNEYILDKLSP
jgi:uncharacterized membrane protein